MHGWGQMIKLIPMIQRVSKNLDALLITNPTNIRYLTGFVGAAPEERESYLLITNTQAFLFTNSLYIEQAKTLALLNCYIVILLKTKKTLEIVEISRENPIGKQLAIIVKQLKIRKLGFEEKDLTVAELRKLEKELKGITLVPTSERIEKLRMIKREGEIENIRKAAKLTDQCFTSIFPKLTPGVEERKIAWEIEKFIKERGAELAFSPIVAFGKNTSQPHYVTGNSQLTTNNLILLDFGARINGYCSDMTRLVFIGNPRDEWKQAYAAVLRAQMQALEALLTKRSGAQLDRLARRAIKQAGFPVYPHSLGHSVGLAIHETPRLTVKKDTKLKAGMVFTIEPAVYKEGQYGIRIEDLILLKKNGIEILSKSPKGIIVL